MHALTARLREALDGRVDPTAYAIVRIALATLVLVRVSDVGRGVVRFDHHLWVRGLEHHPTVEAAVEPVLSSPLVAGLPAPADALAEALVLTRLALAVCLLVGLFPRVAAGGVAAIGFFFLAVDRHAYFHHLHLLWLSCAWLALARSGERWSVMRLVRPAAATAPAWPLALIRLHVASVYAASGLAKLSSDWLSGRTLTELAGAGFVSGPVWESGRAVLGASGVAASVCAAELALPLLLAWRKTRIAAVVLGIGLHLAIDSAMMVSTFGATMVALLPVFLPFSRRGTLSVDAARRSPSRSAPDRGVHRHVVDR